MEKLLTILKRNWTYLVGAISGGITGYLYWYFIGCSSGTCPITASPVNSIAWGVIMGGLLFSLFKKGANNE
ncbi:hypothetical protein JGH11_01775 [Dysgonomonas sp. Marseille-P4677]|uniref:hypothetical protein n=1 Tax=Dysgonomonas sp. Marseille-P4677 TaxID=2364790 RepID=UPI001911AA74|nr:hypothetical protein [Dysgonomonas sp. Marseille-P4677]MBK5719592.1 hypothetical protein [Dysgonomonas sp. Marseille-P4677]